MDLICTRGLDRRKYMQPVKLALLLYLDDKISEYLVFS